MVAATETTRVAEGEEASELVWVVPALHAMMGTEMTAGVCFRPDDGRLSVRAARTVNVPDSDELVGRCRALVQAMCDGQGSAKGRWSDGGRAPRNQVLVYTRADVANDNLPAGAPFLVPPTPTGKRHDQICVMICDGAQPLAWLGGWQRARFDDEQRRRLRAVVAPLRRRLIWERQVADAPRTTAALVAALEAIGTAAVIVDTRGAILHANRAGYSLIDRDRAGVARSLVAAVGGLKTEPAWKMSALADQRSARGFLAVLSSPARDTARAALVRMAAARWHLTRRQQDVLELLARGLANAIVAEALSISESTVEFHVTAILDKAGSDSRTSLLARLIDG